MTKSNRSKFMEHPTFVEYEELLKSLHRLLGTGHGQSAEAKAIRSQMAVPECDLTYEELDRLDGLSADLYMLHGREVFESAEDSGDPAKSIPDMRLALESEAWDTVLSILRTKAVGATVPDEFRAYLRAQAYAGLGQIDTAFLFMEYASKLNAGEVTYAILVLDYLERHDLERAGKVAASYAAARNRAILSELAVMSDASRELAAA